MRLPSSYLTSRRPLELQMTPMIDCVFLLLVYFLWSSSFVPLEYLLPGELSAATSSAGGATNDEPPPPEADFEDIVIRLIGRGQQVRWEVNGQVVSEEGQLRSLLTRIAGIKLDAPVVLHPDSDVAVGAVIDVYDLARQVGFVKIQFTTNQPPS